jgi:hypothetical protein
MKYADEMGLVAMIYIVQSSIKIDSGIQKVVGGGGEFTHTHTHTHTQRMETA